MARRTRFYFTSAGACRVVVGRRGSCVYQWGVTCRLWTTRIRGETVCEAPVVGRTGCGSATISVCHVGQGGASSGELRGDGGGHGCDAHPRLLRGSGN